jgi:hypothetical protein
MQRIVVFRREDRVVVASWYSKRCLELSQARAAWQEFAGDLGLVGEFEVHLEGECEQEEEVC